MAETKTKKNKNKLKNGFRVTVKNGDSTYSLDASTGTYQYQNVDLHLDYSPEKVCEALAEFFNYVADEYSDSLVTLSFKRPPRKY